MGVVANLFYSDMGYTLNQIATISKFWGLIATIFGVFLGGILIKRIGLYKSLIIGAILVMVTNLLFSYVAISQKNLTLLKLLILETKSKK